MDKQLYSRLISKMNRGEKLYIVDLDSVSFFDTQRLQNIANNETEYEKTPFLYLVSSYLKNSAIKSADSRLKFVDKKSNYNWKIYSYIKD